MMDTDLFSPDGVSAPKFHVGWMWQEHKEFTQAKFEYGGTVNKGNKLSDEYWKALMEAVKPSIKPGDNIQHTGAFILWKGFGKKKIRKSIRNRPAGWHGNHPEQKPIKHDRETLDSIAQWTPPSAAAGSVDYDKTASRYTELDDDEMELQEREEAIAEILASDDLESEFVVQD